MAKSMTNNQLLIREYVKQQFSTQQFADESTYFEFLAASQTLVERLKILREKAYMKLEILKNNQETMEVLKKNLVESKNINSAS